MASVNVYEFSVICAKYLHKKENSLENWIIKKGLALDSNLVISLGQFDIVYFWGVLHHTGNMYKAFNNVVEFIKKTVFFIWLFIIKILNII